MPKINHIIIVKQPTSLTTKVVLGGCGGCLFAMILFFVLSVIFVGKVADEVVKQMEEDKTFTLQKFNNIENGMSFEDVVSIVGEPTEMQSDSEVTGIQTTMYSWNVNDSFGANFNVMIQDGKVISKAQFGLK